jgi:5-methylcytosine-specific restriction enzyme A
MRQVDEWQGKTDDARIPDRVRLRVFQKTQGRCQMCQCLLVPGKWDVDHIIAIAAGGEHRELNLQPLCSGCHVGKTRQDIKTKAKIQRQAKKAAGIRKPSKMPGSRNSKFKKKLNGKVELR